jgi:pimeloyl-ACP methyl ester carboxylesterase
MKKIRTCIAFLIFVQIAGARQTNSGFAEINATRIYYETAGAGEPVIFIHGMALDSRVWNPQWEAFAKAFRVIRYDVRGFGKSGRVTATHNPTEDLKLLMDFLNIKKATLIGHSMGGNIALNFAVKHPGYVKKVIAADAIVDGFANRTPELNQIFKTVTDTTREKGWKHGQAIWLRSSLFQLYLGDSACLRLLHNIVGEYHGDHFYNRSWAPSYGEPATIELLTQVKSPVLIITGEKDEQTLVLVADLLHQKLTDNRKLVMVGAGHFPNLDKPDEFNKLCMEFIKQ